MYKTLHISHVKGFWYTKTKQAMNKGAVEMQHWYHIFPKKETRTSRKIKKSFAARKARFRRHADEFVRRTRPFNRRAQVSIIPSHPTCEQERNAFHP